MNKTLIGGQLPVWVPRYTPTRARRSSAHPAICYSDWWTTTLAVVKEGGVEGSGWFGWEGRLFSLYLVALVSALVRGRSQCRGWSVSPVSEPFTYFKRTSSRLPPPPSPRFPSNRVVIICVTWSSCAWSSYISVIILCYTVTVCDHCVHGHDVLCGHLCDHYVLRGGGGGGAVVVGHTHRQRVSTTFFDSEKLTLFFLVRAPDGIRTSVLCIWRPTLYQLAAPSAQSTSCYATNTEK